MYATQHSRMDINLPLSMVRTVLAGAFRDHLQSESTGKAPDSVAAVCPNPHAVQ